MKSKIFFILLVFFFSLLPLNSFAEDTDIYLASGQGVQPNILIIFDNSGSMSDTVPCQPIGTRIYQKRNNPWGGGYYWDEYANDIDGAIAKIGGTPCPVVRTNLDTTLGGPGYHDGYTRIRNSTCSRNWLTLATGAWIIEHDTVNPYAECAKIDVAKKVIDDFLANIQDVRVGVMIFNSNNEGGRILGKIDSISNNRATLRTAVAGLTASTYTPLAETLYEAGLYFKGEHYFDPNSYESPILYWCQKNYVILITDGMSTQDLNPILNTLPNNGDYDGKGEDPYGPPPCSAASPCYSSGGSDYLNDVAKYIYDTPCGISPYGISVYTIGFAIDYDLLKRAAEQANGHYYTANDSQQLQGAFANVIEEILEKSTSFVAPIVPVSRLERTTAGDKIYLALFKPKLNKMWSGNIKKYGVAQSNGTGYKIGDVLDKNGLKAVDDATGQFYAGSISYWNTTQDGGEVESGGAGEILKNRDLDTRKIYTFLKSSATLNLYGSNNNAFTTTNPLINTGTGEGGLNLASGSKDDLINFVYGYNAYQDDVCPNQDTADVTRTRCWILGSFLHSRPNVVNYKTQSVIFVGSNDGMLHAFDDADGTELWAFIPPDLLPNLQYLHSDYNMAYVDGSMKAYVTYDSDNNVTKAIILFGERRGGNRYYALDVTTPSQPKLLWYISPTERVFGVTTYTTDYEQLGQTWSTPVIGKIACSGSPNCVDGKRLVAFIGGGYDAANQDLENPFTSSYDSVGRAIYVVDILDGSLVKHFSNAEYSIPSDIASLDVDGNGKIDRLYVGDMGGRMWRFDIQDANPSNWTVKIIFKSNDDGAMTNLRKMFYPPTVTLEVGYEMLIFGTGDREHPNDKTIVNRLYAVKDKNLTDTPSNRAYIESDLYDATYNLIQAAPTDAERQAALAALYAAKGWLVQLSSTVGEKCLAAPVVFAGVAYFTTFSPSETATGTDPCYVGEGVARLYEMEYKTATAMFDLDGNTVLGTNDRSQVIGTAIPSGVIITVIQNKVVGYAGMGGGVIGSKDNDPNNPDPCPTCPGIYFRNRKPLVPINWRLVF